MERNYDEVISDMLIQLDRIERRMQKADRRMDLTIKRMVKTETRMELFDKKLNQSIKDQMEYSRTQAAMNEYFLNFIKNLHGKK
jgi:hypothetical protein